MGGINITSTTIFGIIIERLPGGPPKVLDLSFRTWDIDKPSRWDDVIRKIDQYLSRYSVQEVGVAVPDRTSSTALHLAKWLTVLWPSAEVVHVSRESTDTTEVLQEDMDATAFLRAGYYWQPKDDILEPADLSKLNPIPNENELMAALQAALHKMHAVIGLESLEHEGKEKVT